MPQCVSRRPPCSAGSDVCLAKLETTSGARWRAAEALEGPGATRLPTSNTPMSSADAALRRLEMAMVQPSCPAGSVWSGLARVFGEHTALSAMRVTWLGDVGHATPYDDV